MNGLTKAILALVVIVSILAVVGWIQFSNDDGNPAVRMDTQEMRDDVNRAADGARGMVGE